MSKEPDTIMSISPAEFRKIELFRSLSYEDLEDVLFKCVLLRIEPGSVVIAPGQPNQRLYILIRGEMSVHLSDVDDDPVARLGRGDVFGELSVIDAQPASAYVVARAPCRLLGIDKDSWWEMFRVSPNIAVNLMSILARRIRDTNRQIGDSGVSAIEGPELDIE